MCQEIESLNGWYYCFVVVLQFVRGIRLSCVLLFSSALPNTIWFRNMNNMLTSPSHLPLGGRCFDCLISFDFFLLSPPFNEAAFFPGGGGGGKQIFFSFFHVILFILFNLFLTPAQTSLIHLFPINNNILIEIPLITISTHNIRHNSRS